MARVCQYSGKRPSVGHRVVRRGKAKREGRAIESRHVVEVLAGDLAQVIAAGLLDPAQIAGDLIELAQGRVRGRESDAERTVFKSAGMSQEDLLAAMQVAGL